MKVPLTIGLGVIALLVWSMFGIRQSAMAVNDDRSLFTQAELAAIFRHSPMPPVPADRTDKVADDPKAARFGQFLFFDKKFSANGEVSCETCHQPARAFTDGRRLAKGLAIGTRHSPSILGAAYNQWYFWDGRTDSQWSQALQPFENPREIGTDRLHVVHVVRDDVALRRAYEKIFGSLPPLGNLARFPLHARPGTKAWVGMTAADRFAVDRAYSNLGKSIEAYERKLIVGNSAFDRYVAALKAANIVGEAVISPAAKRGLKLFVGAGNCELCHSGPDFTDGQFHNLGLPLLASEVPDTGRAEGIRLVRSDPFNGAGAFSDDPRGVAKDRLAFLPAPQTQIGAFKTPSLRNVARIAPHLHDGRFRSLAQVMNFYAKGKAASRGRLVGAREQTVDLIPHLTGRQQSDLIAFLKTLNDPPLPANVVRQPPQP